MQVHRLNQTIYRGTRQLFESLGNLLRHALGVVIKQREAILPRSKYDTVGGAGDDVHRGAAIKLALGGDVHHQRQSTSQRSERDCLMGLHILDQRAELADTFHRHSGRHAARHHAGGAVALRRTPLIETDTLGERPAQLVEDDDLRLHHSSIPSSGNGSSRACTPALVGPDPAASNLGSPIEHGGHEFIPRSADTRALSRTRPHSLIDRIVEDAE